MIGVFSAAFWQVVIAGRAGLLQICRHVAVPHVVGEAGGVGHEMAQRDRLFGRPQFRLALGVETFQHLRRGEVRQQLADRLVQRELALLDQLHAGRGRDRLGHRGDPEHAVGGHGIVLGQVAFAERALVDHLIAGRGHRDHAGNFLGLAFLTQNLIDLSFALHGVASRLFFWSARSSSRRRDPASASRASARCRDLVMGRWRGQDFGEAATQTATLGHNLRWMSCNAGDRSGHPR